MHGKQLPRRAQQRLKAYREATAKARERAATPLELEEQRIRLRKLQLLDSLPEPVRKALSEARYSWPVEQIVAFYRGGAEVEGLVKFIHTADEGLLKQRSRV